MNDKIIKIYTAVFNNIDCSKEGLKNYLEVSSIKTVENNIKEIDDIEYDIKLRKYKFINLLPKYIPNEVFFHIFKDSIVNKLLNNDFMLLKKDISSLKTRNMIKTAELSNLAKRIIIFENAINNNCVLKVQYKKAGHDFEVKYIRPHSIFSNGFTYYTSITYDKLNNKDKGKERTFAFSAIGDIKAIEYLNDEVFKQEYKGNAFGTFNKERFVILNLNTSSANFFKREILFNNDAFEIIDEELDGAITIKMYYNKIFEVIKLIQQWMPNITIQNNDEIREEVYQKIKANFGNLDI